MIEINPHFNELAPTYLFSLIAQKVAQYKERHPQRDVIRLGIGDTVLPLAPSVVRAWQEAVAEMGREGEYRGYGPEQGYQFLRKAIAEHEYGARGIEIDESEVFVSDGAKCDSANIQELFSTSARIAIPNPVYPVYYDSNVIAGRGKNIHFLHARKEHNFVAQVDADARYDLIYLCYPNNPTGVSATKDELRRWVEYARERRALIIFDAAYERFITDPATPHSIYEIEGAREVAIEMRSYSKSAGFTGARCAFTVVPKRCAAYHKGERVSLHPLWLRRCSTKFNGVSYPVQRAAAATYSADGARETDATIRYYLKNAQIIRRALDKIGAEHYGGIDSPYIWLATGTAREKTKPRSDGDGGGVGNSSDDARTSSDGDGGGVGNSSAASADSASGGNNNSATDNNSGNAAAAARTSWELFDTLLHEAQVVTTPGVGFGASGEGYIRISAFSTKENVERACPRIIKALR